MEASRRERIILYGVVPIAAALVGAIATVVVGRFFGDTHPTDAVMAVVRDRGLSAADKIKMLNLLNNNTDKFYNFLSGILSIVSVMVGFTGVAIGQRIMQGRRS